MSWSKPVSSDKSWDHRSWKSRTTWQDDQWNSSSWNPGWQDASQPVSSGKWPNKSWQDSWEHKPSPDSHGPATPDKRTPMRNPDLKYSPSGKPSGAPTSFPGSWTTDAHHHDTKPIFGRTLPNKVVETAWSRRNNLAGLDPLQVPVSLLKASRTCHCVGSQPATLCRSYLADRSRKPFYAKS